MDARKDRDEKLEELKSLIAAAPLYDYGQDGKIVEWRDDAGKSISDERLKTFLWGVLHTWPWMNPTLQDLRRTHGIRKRTAQRAIMVLQREYILKVHSSRGPQGQIRNTYEVLPGRLRWLVEHAQPPLFQESSRRSATGDDRSATDAIPGATAETPSATGALGLAPPGSTVAPLVALTDVSLPYKTLAPSDDDEDGARKFSFEELASIREKFNQLGNTMGVRINDPDDRELILKVATLWHDNRLTLDSVQQLLESFRLKRREIENPFKWLWKVMREQCKKSPGDGFEKLLATTDFPREMLVSPEARATR